jgi:phosphoesterase RecJ-like protein
VTSIAPETIEAFHRAIEDVEAISIFTHINPDADTIGTALGIYEILKHRLHKKVEVVNVSNALPHALDFLPHYHKIKLKSDFTKSLVITCDCGSLDRVGVALSGRSVVNIDHHLSNRGFGTINLVDEKMASTSQVAYRLFKPKSLINSHVATCFYTALVSDTNFFTTSSVNEEVFQVAHELTALGANASEVAFHLTQRRPLSALRILQMSLETLQLHCDATVAMVVSSQEAIKASGAVVADLDGIVESVRALATVKVAIHIMVLEGSYRVSLRSKEEIDVSQLAKCFGGGGHQMAAGFTLDIDETSEIEALQGRILLQIEALGLVK